MPTLRNTVKSLSSNARFVRKVFGAKDCWIYTQEKHILNVFPVTIAYILDVTKAITLKLTLPDILPAIFPSGKSVFRFLCKGVFNWPCPQQKTEPNHSKSLNSYYLMMFQLKLLILDQWTQYIAEWDGYKVNLCHLKRPEITRFSQFCVFWV